MFGHCCLLPPHLHSPAYSAPTTVTSQSSSRGPTSSDSSIATALSIMQSGQPQDCCTSQGCSTAAHSTVMQESQASTLGTWLRSAAWTGKFAAAHTIPAATMQPTKETCYQHHACCRGLTYCTLLCAAWDYVDAAVAYIFGLDESKYQWAVYTHQQQLAQVCNWQAGLPCSKNTICCAHFRYAWWRPALENPGSPARRWQLAGMHA